MVSNSSTDEGSVKKEEGDTPIIKQEPMFTDEIKAEPQEA